MRHAAILLMLLGCSSGPSVVVTDPPPVPIVVEPAEAPIEWQVVPQRHRDPVEAPRPIVVYVDAVETPLPEHPGEPEYAPLPDVPPAPPGSFQAWMKDQLAKSCECGETCDCVDCQCPDCPHKSTRELVIIGAEWCGPCRKIHAEHADTPGVRFVDLDLERTEACRLWAGARVTARAPIADGAPPVIPAFVLVVDGEPVKQWTMPSGHPPGIETMRDYDPSGASQPTHDAPPQDADKAGSPSHVQVNAGRGYATGVCVGTLGDRSLVLTNHHVCYERGRPTGVPSVYLGDRWIPGEIIASDKDADLALFSVAAPLRPVAIADVQPVAGSQVRTYGYGGGRHTPRVTVTLAAHPDGGTMVGCFPTRLAFIPGESGAGVMHDGKLVGLVTGRDKYGRVGVVVDLASIRSFLARQGVL